MAFNESDLPAVTSTGLSSASRGVDTNEAFGKLFSGIGQSIERGLAAYDTVTQTNLQIDTFNEADKLANENMPPALQEAEGNIQTLVSAKKQGKLSEAEFAAKVAQRAKEIRSRLPEGYAPMVDQMLSSALGASTANDLRKARIAELNAAADAQDAGAKERRKYIESNENLIQTGNVKVAYKRLTGKDLTQDVASGEYNYAALQYAISSQKSADYERDAALKEIEFNGKAAAPAARKVGGQLLRQVFNDQAGAPFGDWLKQVAAAQAVSSDGGVEISKDEKLAMTQVWNNIRTSAQQEYLRLISRPEFANVSGEIRNELKSMFDQQIALYDDALSGEKYGLLTAVARESSYIQESDKLHMLKISPEARRATLGKSLGLPDAVLESIYIQNGAAYEALNRDLIRVVTGEALVGNRGVMDIIENEAAKDTTSLQSVVQGTIKNLQTALNNPRISEENLPALASRIFRTQNDDLLKKLAAKDRIGTFKTFLTPRVVEAVKKDPQAFQNMANWATTQFDAVSKTARDTMFDAQAGRAAMDISFDGTKFVVKPAQPGVGSEVSKSLPGIFAPGISGVAGQLWESYQTRNAVNAIADVNQYIATMVPIWEAQGISPEQGVNMTFQMNIGDVPKEGSVLDMLGKKVLDFFKQDEEGSKSEQKPKAGSDKRSGLMNEGEAKLLSFVSVAEGADYNTMFGGKRADLSRMTVNEVLAFNKGHGKRTGSSATGAYQIMHDTLRDLVKAGVVDEDELFTEDVQDRAALALLNRRGYGKYKAGKISAEKFADSLAYEWAALPNSQGVSQYQGDKMGNKSTVRRQALMDAIASL